MKKKKHFKKSVSCFLLSCIFIVSTLCVIRTAKTDTNTYLAWEGRYPAVRGYIEIINLPKVLTIGETYKITANFSVKELNYADAVKFGKIEWALQAKNETYTLGYSFLDANMTKYQEYSTISHWGFLTKPAIGGGRLIATANISLINSTDNYDNKISQPISIDYSPIINIRVGSDLHVKPESLEAHQGIPIILNGKLETDYGNVTEIPVGDETIDVLDKTVIKYTFTSPSGQNTTQSINTDLYGNFFFKFTPNATGLWFITANYSGSPYVLPSTSNIIAINVEPPDSFPFWFGAIPAIIAILIIPTICRLENPFKNLITKKIRTDKSD
jgi:hypothetical protein